MRDIVFEGEHLEDSVQKRDDGGGPQKVYVSFDEDALEFFELGAGVGRAAKAGLCGLLLERGIEGGVYLEFPVGRRGEVDVHGKGSKSGISIDEEERWGVRAHSLDSAVDFDHVFLQQPKIIDVENRIIPPIPSCSIPSTSRLKNYMLS